MAIVEHKLSELGGFECVIVVVSHTDFYNYDIYSLIQNTCVFKYVFVLHYCFLKSLLFNYNFLIKTLVQLFICYVVLLSCHCCQPLPFQISGKIFMSLSHNFTIHINIHTINILLWIGLWFWKSVGAEGELHTRLWLPTAKVKGILTTWTSIQDNLLSADVWNGTCSTWFIWGVYTLTLWKYNTHVFFF